MPFFEEEIRDDVLEAWHRQGMPATVTADSSRSFFGLDRIETVPSRISPAEGEIRSAADLKRIIRRYEEQPVKFLTREYWEEKAQAHAGRDYPLGLVGWDGFQLPLFPPSPHKEHNEWDNLINLYYLLKDDPRAVRNALSFIAGYYIKIVSFALRFLDFDFVIISEPIASTTGPVISPRDFAYLVLPQYPRLVAAYKKMGIPRIMFSSISNIKALLPAVAETGVDGLRVTQIMNAGVDYVELGRQFPSLFLLGGIESIRLLESGQAVIDEVKRKAAPLLARGRWLPALDDTLRANVPYERFLTYREALQECVLHR